LIGLGYTGLAIRDSMSDGLIANIDGEDRFWYGALPLIAYLAEVIAGATLAWGVADGSAALAASIGLLLLAGIHNAWDITVWMISRRQG